MNLDDYIEGTFNPDNPANQDDDIDVNDIEVLDFEQLQIN